jgi:citrate lyase subunit beta/citryl-CoA lyase
MKRLSGASAIAPLFVPGHRIDRILKAAASGADAVIIDLEDAVPDDQKEAARGALAGALPPFPTYIRVNGDQTRWHADDLLAAAKLPIAGVILPKAEMGDAIACWTGPHPLIALIESARGLADARIIAALPFVERLAFGSVDFCADLGCAHAREPLLAARLEIVLASRLAGIEQPLDGVTLSTSDAEEAESDARYAADLGFGGKLCIHPKQIAPVLHGFAPGAVELVWAQRIADGEGGAVAVDGAMVDAPVRERAHAILRRHARSRGA